MPINTHSTTVSSNNAGIGLVILIFVFLVIVVILLCAAISYNKNNESAHEKQQENIKQESDTKEEDSAKEINDANTNSTTQSQISSGSGWKKFGIVMLLILSFVLGYAAGSPGGCDNGCSNNSSTVITTKMKPTVSTSQTLSGVNFDIYANDDYKSVTISYELLTSGGSVVKSGEFTTGSIKMGTTLTKTLTFSIEEMFYVNSVSYKIVSYK